MGLFGVDYSYDPPDIPAMAAAGVKFACRYLSPNPAKNLTKTEADRLLAHGISPVSNWEEYARQTAEGYSTGKTVAVEAWRQHRAYGGPAHRPIYFSVDFDANSTELARSYEFLKGCAEAEIAPGEKLGWNRVGVYGGYKTIAYMSAKSPRPAFYWQTYAWSGGQWHSAGNLQQYDNNNPYHGGTVDFDRSVTADFGQWTYNAPPPPPPEDDLIGLKKGDTGQRVVALRGLLLRAGFISTVTDTYDSATSAAVLAMRKSRGSSATSGDVFDGWAYEQLQSAVFHKLFF